MAKNQVTLTFAGDADQLTKAFQKVQTEAKETETAIEGMSTSTGRSFDGFRRRSSDAADGIDRVSDAADKSEQRIVGMRDGITGTKDLMEGWRTGSMELVLTGFADLASSVANFAGPVLGRLAAATGLTTLATKAQAAAQTALNAVMNANPYVKIALLIAALAAAVVIAYQRSETFRGIVKGAFDAVRTAAEKLKDAGQAVIDKLLALYNHPVGQAIAAFYVGKFRLMWEAVQKVKDFIEDIPGALAKVRDWGGWDRIYSVFSGAFGPVKTLVGGVRDAIQAVIDKADWAIRKVEALVEKIGEVKSLPGKLVDAVIPGRANGGIMGAGELYRVREQGPEIILPLNRPERADRLMRQHGIGGGGITININGATVRDSSDIDRLATAIGQRVAMAGVA